MDSRRRLPIWMMGQNPQAKDSNNNNNNDDHDDVDVNNRESKQFGEDNGKLIKARRQRSNTSKRKLGGDEEAEKLSSTSVLVRCEERKKRGKRKFNVGEDDCDNGDSEIPMEKKKGRERKRKEVKLDKSRVDSNGNEEIRDCKGVSDGDDDDLTVEDLMTIAEEYVKEDKEVGQTRTSSKDDLSVDDLMSIAKEYVEDDTYVKGEHLLKDKEIAERKLQDIQRFSKKEEDRERFLNENVMNEETISKPIMSGDPAQDMLDLFLGPLLKKPHDEEKKFNVITRDTNVLYEAHKQKQSVSPDKEAIPVTKKKSSLRDKVALFLD